MDYPGNITPQNPDTIEATAKKILLALFYFFGGGGGGIPITSPSVTRHSAMADSGGTAAVVIPNGAKGYGFIVISGTASDGTVSGIAAGVSQSDGNTLVTGFTVTATGGQTYVIWNT